jgi:hypothetical protein
LTGYGGQRRRVALALFYSLSMAESEPAGEIARSELRASHDDRDQVVELLRVSAGDGRLTAEELDERLELAMIARTYGELAKLVADLPASGFVAVPAVSAPAARAKDIVRIDCRSGHVRRADRWVVPQRMEVKVTSGHVMLDFTRAVITQSSLRIDLDVRSGHVMPLRPATGRGPGGCPDRSRPASHSSRRDQPGDSGPGRFAGGDGDAARAGRGPGHGGHRGTGRERAGRRGGPDGFGLTAI